MKPELLSREEFPWLCGLELNVSWGTLLVKDGLIARSFPADVSRFREGVKSGKVDWLISRHEGLFWLMQIPPTPSTDCSTTITEKFKKSIWNVAQKLSAANP